MEMTSYCVLSNYSKILLFVMLLAFAQSCHKDDPIIQQENPIEEVDPCMESLDSYIIINDEKHILDLDDPELIVRCEFDSSVNTYIVVIDEVIQTVGGIEINDVIGIGFGMEELNPGSYNLVRIDESFCDTGDFALMPNDAFSSIQTSNCCNFYNAESTIQIFECDNSTYIKADSLVYSELQCDLDQGGSFVASFQIKCI